MVLGLDKCQIIRKGMKNGIIQHGTEWYRITIRLSRHLNLYRKEWRKINGFR